MEDETWQETRGGVLHRHVSLQARAPDVRLLGCRYEAVNRKQFIETMREVETALGSEGGPFFLGKELSLVDIVFAPFLERIVASIPYYKGEQLRGSP